MTITRIKQRRGTAAAWTAANPTLDSGEFGVETDTGKIKLGDGSTAWTALNYLLEDAALTGTPTAPTAPPGTDTTQVANTAFVKDAVDNATSDRVWLPANQFQVSVGAGTPTLTGVGKEFPSWLLDANILEGVFASWLVPPGWATVDIDLHHSNPGATSGNVRWRIDVAGGGAAGANLNAIPVNVFATVAATPVASLRSIEVGVATGQAVTAGAPAALRVYRLADDAADTLANDIRFLGLMVRKAS